MDLIYVHVPKCAGTALREALTDAYGHDQIYQDVSDRLLDPLSPINIRRDDFLRNFRAERAALLARKHVVHGHLCIQKYDGIDALRVTILRHPIDRLISHYFFWIYCAPHGHSLHDKFLAERPTITQFAQIPQIARFYERILFRDADMSIFDLVGLTEQMDETIARLEKLIGKKLKVKRSNENGSPFYTRQRAEILQNPKIMRELADALREDIAFYERFAAIG
jgi:hypothetical protein